MFANTEHVTVLDNVQRLSTGPFAEFVDCTDVAFER